MLYIHEQSNFTTSVCVALFHARQIACWCLLVMLHGRLVPMHRLSQGLTAMGAGSVVRGANRTASATPSAMPFSGPKSNPPLFKIA